MVNVPIWDRADCQAYWHYQDASWAFVDGDPAYYRLTEWVDRRSGRKLIPSSTTSARRGTNGAVKVMAGGQVTLPSNDLYRNGAFTIYVSSVGASNGSLDQGLLYGYGQDLRFAANTLQGVIGSTVLTGAAGIGPGSDGIIVHFNSTWYGDGHRLYWNGHTSAGVGDSQPHVPLIADGLILQPGAADRNYRAIAIFSSAHSEAEIGLISDALLNANPVPQVYDLVAVPQATQYADFTYSTAPPTAHYTDIDFEVGTPDYCTYPAGA